MASVQKWVHQHKRIGILIVVLITTCITIALLFFIYPVHKQADVGSVRALDSANTISDPAWFHTAYSEGFRLYIMHSTTWGTCTPWPNTQSQLKMALDAGLKIAVYTRNPTCWQAGINAVGPYQNKLQFFALDIEKDPGIPATRAMIDGIKAMGVRPVIYTSASDWPALQGNTADDFHDIPLWDAHFTSFDYNDWTADYLQPTPAPFAGWNTPANMRIGVQQQLEYSLNGVKVDLNAFNQAFLLSK